MTTILRKSTYLYGPYGVRLNCEERRREGGQGVIGKESRAKKLRVIIIALSDLYAGPSAIIKLQHGLST